MKRSIASVGLIVLTITLSAGAAPPAAPAPPSVTSLWSAVDAILGAAGRDLPGGVHRFGWPRRDLAVTVGDVPVAPALALGSWAGFLAAGGGAAMAMGDLVLLESEVAPVLRALQAAGLEVGAIHNHLLGESPRVVYVHFAAHGDRAAIARGLRDALGKTATPLGPAPPAVVPAADGAAALQRFGQALGRSGAMAGAVLQVGVPRAEPVVDHGVELPPGMGTATAINAEAIGGAQVAATGDFVLTAGEVNPVVRELLAHGIEPTALHSHMLAESPRLLFLHFWGVGTPEEVGAGLKAALARVHTRS